MSNKKDTAKYANQRYLPNDIESLIKSSTPIVEQKGGFVKWKEDMRNCYKKK
jgi:hypothetical protein